METKKKLFLWDLSRYIILFFIIYTYIPASELYETDINGAIIRTAIEEFFTNDGHIWGDYYMLLTGIDIRGPIWFLSMLAIVLLDYLWAYKKSNIAKKIRIANWTLALISYASYTILFPLHPKYDYFIFAYALSAAGWPVSLAAIMILSIIMMWLGVILINGYLIYKALDEENSQWSKSILILMSIGAPGSGHIATGKYRQGIFFLIMAPIIWTIGLFTLYIPTILFWTYSAYHLHKNS